LAFKGLTLEKNTLLTVLFSRQ